MRCGFLGLDRPRFPTTNRLEFTDTPSLPPQGNQNLYRPAFRMPTSPPHPSRMGSSSKRGKGAQLRAAPSPASGDEDRPSAIVSANRATASLSAAAAAAAGGPSVPIVPSSFSPVGAPSALVRAGVPTLSGPALRAAAAPFLAAVDLARSTAAAGGATSGLLRTGGSAALGASVTRGGAAAAIRAQTSAEVRDGGGLPGQTSVDTVPRLVASAPAIAGSATAADPPGLSQNPVQQDGRIPPPSSSKGRLSKKRKAKGKTPFAKRYHARRPAGRHPGLKLWDNLTREVRSSLSGQERKIFSRTGLLVGRFDLQLYVSLEECGGHLIGATFPRAPAWWPSDWGRVPIPLPLEVSLHRQQLVTASDSSAWWRELYQLFLQQIAAGWDLEYKDPTRSQKHTLPSIIAQAILDFGGFYFLPASSDTIEVFRSHHALQHVSIPVQQVANQAAWAGIAQARLSEPRVRPDRASARAPSWEIPPSSGWDVPSPIPSPLASPSLQSLLDVSGLPGALREALAGEAELYVNTTEKCVAVASAAVRLAIKMYQARERVADLVRGATRIVDPARLEAELIRELNAFPSLSRNLPRLFHMELGRMHDSQGGDTGPSQPQPRYP